MAIRHRLVAASAASALALVLTALPASAATTVSFTGPSNVASTYAAYADAVPGVELIAPAAPLCTGTVSSGNVNNLPDAWDQDNLPLQGGGTVDVSHVFVADATLPAAVGAPFPTTDVATAGLAAVTLSDHDPHEWHGSSTIEPASDWCLSDGDLSSSGETPNASTTAVRFDFDGASAGNGQESFGIWIDDCEVNATYPCRAVLLDCSGNVVSNTVYTADTNNSVMFVSFTAAATDGVCALVVSSAASAGPGASIGWGTPAVPRAFVAPPAPVVPEGTLAVGLAGLAVLGGGYVLLRTRRQRATSTGLSRSTPHTNRVLPTR